MRAEKRDWLGSVVDGAIVLVFIGISLYSTYQIDITLMWVWVALAFYLVLLEQHSRLRQRAPEVTHKEDKKHV